MFSKCPDGPYYIHILQCKILPNTLGGYLSDPVNLVSSEEICLHFGHS